MKLDLNQCAIEWVTEVGHELDGITAQEVMDEVNANLPTGTEWNDENMQEVEFTVDPITLDDAETMRRIIEDYLHR